MERLVMHESKKNIIYANPEFQSALVRLGVWVFAVIYVSTGILSERYQVDVRDFVLLFAVYLLFFFTILTSVLIRPVWEARRYFSLVVDISATSICLYLTGEVVSPFYVLYIWIFISYGTRYGRQHLMVASVLSILAYCVLLTLMNQWGEYFFEASFVLIALCLLPVYQNSLINKLHVARSEAERSNDMVGRFLSNMTNSMRAPLADIVTTSTSLGDSRLNMNQLDKVEQINSSAALLDSNIGDVLDFSKLEAQQLIIQTVPFSLHALMSEICSAINRYALMDKIELICSISAGVPKVIIGDEQRLKQVLNNLIKFAINNCPGYDLGINVQIDGSDHSMLLFELKDIAQEPSGEDSASYGNFPFMGSETAIEDEINPDLGISLARRLAFLMGGDLEIGFKEEGPVFSLRLPAITNDFEDDQVFRFSSLSGKKAFVFEPNKPSRDVISECCENNGMIVGSVDNLGELGAAISDSRERHDVDIVLIADSPQGRDIERIANICLGVLGEDLPLLILAYKRNCIDLSGYRSAALIRKPFIEGQLVDAMEMVLASYTKHDDDRLSSETAVKESLQ